MHTSRKSILIGLLFLVASTFTQAQVGVGANNPNPSAQLEISSTSKGLLPPRMTITQRNAIISPATGLIIFNTTNNALNIYFSGAWYQLSNSVVLGSIASLVTASPINNGSLVSGSAASGVSSVVSYTGGNGENYSGQSVPSTGVTGLTATLPAGIFALGEGTLTYNITGTPTSDGSASFELNIGGQVGTLTRTITTLSVGQAYQGGIVAYILVSGDPGFDANTQHGLIAAVSDQSEGISWINNGLYPYVSGIINQKALGTGLANTNAIINIQGEIATSYAAGLARAHNGGGYSDWYLPSLDELNKLYINRVAIGGFAATYYWSSSGNDLVQYAWFKNFSTAQEYITGKEALIRVRAIRAF